MPFVFISWNLQGHSQCRTRSFPLSHQQDKPLVDPGSIIPCLLKKGVSISGLSGDSSPFVWNTPLLTQMPSGHGEKKQETFWVLEFQRDTLPQKQSEKRKQPAGPPSNTPGLIDSFADSFADFAEGHGGQRARITLQRHCQSCGPTALRPEENRKARPWSGFGAWCPIKYHPKEGSTKKKGVS